MKKYKGVIFDMDGTLLDTIADLGDSVNAAFEVLGFPRRTMEDFKLMVGNGFVTLIKRALPQGVTLTDDKMEEAKRLFLKEYAQRYLDKTLPYEGMPEVVLALGEKGVPMAVDSNKMQEQTTKLALKFFKEDTFVSIIGDSPLYPKKPAPDAVYSILDKMNLKKEDVLFIGDSQVDIETGKNSGLDTLGVAWGFRGEQELIECGATYIAQTPGDILDFF